MLRKLKWEIRSTVFLFIVLPLGLYLWRDYQLGRRLQSEIEAIRRRGEPLTLLEAAPKPVPDDQNAAVLYQQVFRATFSPAHSNRIFAEFNETEQQILDAFRERPNSTDAEWLRQKLAEPGRVTALRTLRKASLRPHSVFPIPWENGPEACFPHYADFRASARLMVQKANLVAYDGDLAEALSWHATVMRMSRHLLDDPTLIGQLVGITVQSISFKELKHTLRNVDLPSGTGDELDAALAALDMRASLKAAMVAERALGIDWFEVAWRDPGTCVDVGRLSQNSFLPLASLFSFVLGPLKTSDKLMYIGLMNEAVSAAGEPSYRSAPKVAAIEGKLLSLQPWQAPLTQVLYPIFARAGTKVDQAQADIDLCRLVLALKAHKRDTGAYPATIKQLQPSLDWTIPGDPFSGQPYVYRRQEQGFILYSVGENAVDDGGMSEYEPQTGKWRGTTSDTVWECVM